MEKKKDRSYLVILILLLICFISSYLLYKNITEGASGNDNPVIGTLTFKNKNVERKYDSDIIWEKIESGLAIRNKDTIRSGELSDAVLTLQDKTTININENSMIYVDISGSEINLNFAYGSMSVSKKSDGESSEITLKIKSGNNTVEVKESDLALEKKGKEDLEFQVNKGSAKIINGKEEKELKTNEKASLVESEIVISEPTINLLSPPDASIITGKSKSIPVIFKWSAKNTYKTKLEIAFDSQFQNIYKTFNAEDDSLSASLEQGTYYWRISTKKSKNKRNKEREFSSFRKLIVYDNSPPILLSPKNEQVFKFTHDTPIIPFNWKRLETARNYKLEVSRDPGFKDIVKSMTVSQSSVSLDNLSTGKYFARVIAQPAREDLNSEISDPISFTIEKKTELDSPVLVSPDAGQEFSSTIFSKSGFLFQVKDSAEVTSYTFQISSKADFGNLLFNETSKTNQIKINSKLEVGKYYWRVLGSTSEGQKTPFSKVRNFSIRENEQVELLAPKNNSVIDLKENPVYLQWKRLSYKAKFLLEVADNPEFTNIIHSIKTEEYSWANSFQKEGTYYWRITSLAEDETVLSKSSVSFFHVEDIHELVPIYPLKNQKVDMSPLDSLQFKWENNPKAAGYLFEFYKEKSRKQSLIIKTKTNSSNFVFKDLTKLEEGNFTWSLQELIERDGEMQTGQKITVPFKIYLSKKLDTPNIKTPDKMYVE